MFKNYNKLVIMESDDYLERLLTVMDEKGDLISFDRGEADFRDFAIKAYLRNLKNNHDEWLDILNAVVSTRAIVDGFETDDFDIEEAEV